MNEKQLPKKYRESVDTLVRSLKSGEIPHEFFLMFLEDPQSVWADIDELRVTWQTAHQADPQERAAILCYIAHAANDREALEASRRNWSEAAGLHPDTREEIGRYTSSVLLAFGCVDEALAVARALPVAKAKFRALRSIFKTTQQDEHLDEVRRAVPREAGVPRVQMLVELASVLRSPADLAQAERELHALSAKPYEENPWLYASYIRAMLRSGKIPEARAALNHLTHADAYRWSLAHLVLATADTRDGLALVQQQPSEKKVRTNIECIDALLDTDQLDPARRFADAAPHPAMQCILRSRIAYHALGTKDDFRYAEDAYRQMTSNPWLGSALLHFAYALTRIGHVRGARKIAARVSLPRDRAKAFLGIYANKDRKEFSDPFTDEDA